MPDDASLTDFLDGVRDVADDADDDPAANDPADQNGDDADDDPATNDDSAGPNRDAAASATFAWSSKRATCAACGASVRRRWNDDGALVCSDCKEW